MDNIIAILKNVSQYIANAFNAIDDG